MMTTKEVCEVLNIHPTTLSKNKHAWGLDCEFTNNKCYYDRKQVELLCAVRKFDALK